MISNRKTYKEPHKKPGFLSCILTSWITDLLWSSFRAKKKVNIDAFPSTPEHLTSSVLGEQLQQLWDAEVTGAREGRKRKPSLLRVLCRAYGPFYAKLGVIVFINETLRIAQPLLLKQLMQYFQHDAEISQYDALFYAGLMSLAALLSAVLSHWFVWGVCSIGDRSRVGTQGLVYKKLLQLRADEKADTDTGKIINVISTDCEKLGWVAWMSHSAWVGPLEAVVILVIVYRDLGLATFSILGVIAVMMPLHSFLSSKAMSFLAVSQKVGDKRMKVLTELINGMRVVKMYCWEKPFGKLIGNIRKEQLDQRFKLRSIMKFQEEARGSTAQLLTVVIVVAHWLLTGQLDAAQVFPLIALMQIVNDSILDALPWCYTAWLEVSLSIQRIENILILPDVVDSEEKTAKKCTVPEKNPKKTETEETDEPIPACPAPASRSDVASMAQELETSQAKHDGSVALRDVTVQWRGSEKPALDHVSLTAAQGQLVGIVGSVGAGKTSLLMTLLREVTPQEGRVDVNGSLSYADQSPWIFSSTVRQNVLFGKSLDEKKLQKAYEVSALSKDLKHFEKGDMTSVGDRGITLSGGQKARLSLARALYTDADIYLLDDPLSAVDPIVGRHIFNRAIKENLAGKTRILVTHQTHFLKQADIIYVLKQGKLVARGTYEELQRSGEELFEASTEAGNYDSQKPSANTDSATLSEDAEDEKEDEDAAGKTGLSVIWRFIKSGTSVPLVGCACLLQLVVQAVIVASDWWLATWADNAALQDRTVSANVTMVTEARWASCDASGCFTPAINSWSNATPTCSDWHSCTYDKLPENWHASKQTPLDTVTSLYVFIGLAALRFVLCLCRTCTFWKVYNRASQALHNKMYNSVIRAPMRFFDNTPHGRIVNRFSSDIGHIDNGLPNQLFGCMKLLVTLCTSVAAVLIMNPWVMLMAAPIAGAVALVKNVFTWSSCNMHRLHKQARSPMYSHIMSTVHGSVTIRAQNVEDTVEEEMRHLTDIHTRTCRAGVFAYIWFAQRLELCAALFISIVIFSAIPFADELTSGSLGLTVNYAMMVTWVLRDLTRISASLEVQASSVERVLEYTELESEAEWTRDPAPPADWPARGALEYRDVSFRYSKDKPAVLSGLSFSVKAGEKIGIVGRTGAGKSSLVQSLFRLTEPQGEILIDDIDVMKLGLHDLRSRICVIPQDPILYSGTLRFNLDPFDRYTDEQIWDSLEQVEMRPVIEKLSEGLGSEVSEGGCNLSLGQRQLLCLARALLGGATLLAMDEATANVDNLTDRTIQRTIRRNFASSTVLTIAHRLHTVMDAHRIMVLDEGRLVEFDTPDNLKKKEGGIFAHMLAEAQA